MPNKIRAYECEDCGEWTVRPRKSNDPWVCYPCGRQRIRDAQLRRWHGGKREHGAPDRAGQPPADSEQRSR